MKAAVLNNVGDARLELRDDVTTAGVGAGKVRVQIKATGVCHSDLSAMNGTIPVPVPAVLGHEGAGEVVEVGTGVTGLREGDHVVVCWSPQCGACNDCARGQPQLCMAYMIDAFSDARFLAGGNTPLFGMAGAGTFAEELVLLEQGAIKIDEDVPYDVASLLGCGVMTGVGAAINAGQVEPGSTVVVFGCGGVGISVIQGARIAGAAKIVAVDMVERKLDWAKQFGATHAVTPADLPQAQRELTAGGFDYAFEVVGRSQTIKAAYDATRRGGTTVVVGAGRADDMVELSAFDLFYNEKNLKGTYYGSANVRRDFPRLLDLWRAGQLDLDGMITRRLGLADVNEAFDAMVAGDVIRQVISFG